MPELTAINDQASVPQPVNDAGDPEVLRAGVYRLLAELLAAPPSAELLARLAQIDESAGDVSDSDAIMADAWQALRLSARRATVESVGDEYSDLFIGLARGELVPYGSWYLTGLLMDQPLAVLRRDLGELGIVRRERVYEPEDHVAALCEAMSLVIATPDPLFEAQRRFFNTHLASWVIRFFGDLQHAKSAAFYHAVGLLGERFFELERRYLAMPG